MIRPLFVLGCLAGLALPGSVVWAGVLPDRIEQEARDLVAAKMYPTLVIGIVDGENSEIVAFGTLPDGRPADGDTVYEIGSITKTFTATLLADAVQSGQVTLDMPVVQLLPDFKIPSRSGKEITLLDLATHHSGFPRVLPNFGETNPLNPFAEYDVAWLKQFLGDYALPRNPGEAYEYSNLGVALLGYALTQVGKEEWSGQVEHKIFEPLGMATTTVGCAGDISARRAPPTEVIGRQVQNWDHNIFASAGGICSTAADMLRYLRANMGQTTFPLAEAMRFAQEPRRDMRGNNRIGLVWMTRTTADGTIAWHDGETAGYSSFMGLTADRRRGVIILTNVNRLMCELGYAALLDTEPLPPVRKIIAQTNSALEEYVGTYELTKNFLLYVNRGEGQLFARATGQDQFPIFMIAPDEFFAEVAGISISFTRDDKGKIDSLVTHQNGDRRAPRLSTAGVPNEPTAVRLDQAELADYVGQFQLNRGVVIDIAKSGDQLSYQRTGAPAFPLYAREKDRFFFKIAEIQVDFSRDDSGKVVNMLIHDDDGKDYLAPRTKP